MEDVKKDFDTAVEQMYGVHVQGYNAYLNDVLGEARAQKYLISDERLKTSFHAFYGTMEKYRYDAFDTCERLKQCIINLDTMVKDKSSRTEANANHKMLMGGAPQ